MIRSEEARQIRVHGRRYLVTPDGRQFAWPLWMGYWDMKHWVRGLFGRDVCFRVYWGNELKPSFWHTTLTVRVNDEAYRYNARVHNRFEATGRKQDSKWRQDPTRVVCRWLVMRKRRLIREELARCR